MKINKKYNGIIIGLIFSIVCFILTFTFIIPVFSLFPGVIIEGIVSSLVSNVPYSNVGKTTILLLIIIFSISIIFICINIRKKTNIKELNNKYIIKIMFLEYFIVHALGFYLYWAIKLNFKSDGQLAFGIIYSYPYSSLSFIFIGILIDVVKRNPI